MRLHKFIEARCHGVTLTDWIRLTKMPDAARDKGEFRMSEAMIELGETKLNCRIDGREGAPWLVFSNSLMTDLHL